MSEGPDAPPPSSRRGVVVQYAPWPLVGVAVLLAIMIVLTPVLQAISENGPGLATRAEVVVDKLPGNATVHFYVQPLGDTVRYDAIRVGIAAPFAWDGTSGLAWSQLDWLTWHNASDVISLSFDSEQNPIALNISAYYVSPAGNTWYVGLVAFYVAVTSPPSGESLYSATGTSGMAVTSPLAVSNTTLPVPILLANAGPGTPP